MLSVGATAWGLKRLRKGTFASENEREAVLHMYRQTIAALQAQIETK